MPSYIVDKKEAPKTTSGLSVPEGILGPGHGDLVDILRQLDLGVTIDIHQLVDTAQGRLTNKRRM